MLEQGNPAAVAHLLLDRLDAAEPEQRVPASLFRGHARPQIVLDVHLDVALELLGEVAVPPLAVEQSAQALDPNAQGPRHHDLPSGARNRAMIPVVRSQSRACLSSCLRPAGVSA